LIPSPSAAAKDIVQRPIVPISQQRLCGSKVASHDRGDKAFGEHSRPGKQHVASCRQYGEGDQ
jgi:hypothetical protein